MITLSPDNYTVVLFILTLAPETSIHDLHSADRASITLHIPAPHGHGVPLLQCEHFLRFLGVAGVVFRLSFLDFHVVAHCGWALLSQVWLFCGVCLRLGEDVSVSQQGQTRSLSSLFGMSLRFGYFLVVSLLLLGFICGFYILFLTSIIIVAVILILIQSLSEVVIDINTIMYIGYYGEFHGTLLKFNFMGNDEFLLVQLA